MLTVVVGTEDAVQSFVIEEPLLRSASPYFENALKNDNFTEGATGRVELDDQDAEIFGLLNEFIHLGLIRQRWRTFEYTTAQMARQQPIYDVESPRMVEWCHVWLLADYLQISTLKNHIMWHLMHMVDSRDYASYLMSIEDVEDVYVQAPMDSMLRKLLVHLCVWGDKNEELELTENAPPDMMRELVRELKKSRKAGGEISPLNDVRNYYENDEEPAAVDEADEGRIPPVREEDL